MEQLNMEISELEKELRQLKLEFHEKDAERYNEWNKLMEYYSNKMRIVQECINTRNKEIEKISDHKIHEWIKDPIYNYELKFPIQIRLKCSICGKTKMKKIKLISV
jgi:hypothetical protein